MGTDGTSSNTSSDGSQSFFAPRSPRIPSLLGAALGYYSVLDRPTSGEVSIGEDGYDQVCLSIFRSAIIPVCVLTIRPGRTCVCMQHIAMII
jgi:hypothetical protein